MENKNTCWRIVPPKRTVLVLSLSSIALLLAAPATAEEAAYRYDFEADFLDGDQLGGQGLRVVPRPTYGYPALIKPRTSYVRELLSSVENL